MTYTALFDDYIADRLAAAQAYGPILNIAIGTGTPTSTALGAELSRRAIISRTASGDTLTVTARWDIEDHVSGTITEVGVFAGTTMIASYTTSKVKAYNDSYAVTAAIKI